MFRSYFLNQLRQVRQVYEPYIGFAIFSLIVFTISRIGLIIWQYPRVVEVNGLWYVLLQGLRFDLVLLSILLSFPVFLAPFMYIKKSTKKGWGVLITVYLLVLFTLFIFIEAATPSFINQYDLRPNVWFIEYLKYPNEIVSMLYTAYKLEFVVAILISFSGSYFIYHKLRRTSHQSIQVKLGTAIIIAPLAFLICIALGRSTLDHRAVNPSTVAFSSDPLVNTLPLNSSYTVLYAAHQLSEEQKNLRPYGEMSNQDVIGEVKKDMMINESLFTDSDLPTMHKHLATTKYNQTKNLVIVLVESLGGEFVSELGGLPLTPNLDRLSKEGMWFENMYATGTRSVRGIEAVVSGFLPTTARSVVKQAQSQRGFFTIASALKEKGYGTSFIYGGEGQFDNMASFFTGNGFEQVIDQDDYTGPVSLGSWGVSDEDLFNKAHQQFSQHDKDKPFFSLVFTSSNHSPYDFPEGGFELYEQPKATVNNAVKYTDYALGEFIKKAKRSSYWDNTVFLIIADHNSRVRGANLVPINGFHIPALILGEDIKPSKIHRISSQIDMVPTLLSLIGVDAIIPATGYDLTRKDIDEIPGRAIMQYADNQAYMENNKVVIQMPGGVKKHFKYEDNKLYKNDIIDLDIERKALAHAIWPTIAYQQMLYQSSNATRKGNYLSLH